MVQDYNQPCCKKPYCNFSGTTGEVTGQGTTLAPVPGVSTLAPQPGTFNTPAPTPKSKNKTVNISDVEVLKEYNII
jgi:hypothetical protein